MRSFLIASSDCKILCWNIRGLNRAAKRASVHNLISSSGASIICLQETKTSNWTTSMLIEALGPSLATQHVSLPANGASGGPLHLTANTTISGVYGPQTDQDKISFLAELASLQPLVLMARVALGDFNLICSAQDQSNGRVNLLLIQRFTRVLDDLQLQKLTLNGRKFSYSNGQDSPTMSKIVHCFASVEWLAQFPNANLQASASLTSDHAPLLIQGNA
ncbi:hypothetical protein BS78_K134600 [Paspalum vaginatum]|uniref:Endonuclease/exonuclease/phosphatase domain-containing protein n=1 Tax=Paspalum vaginatum TaxID=158149 RepID=A0A9W8CDQ9_9POAL|nr:hypothetical protein BS78_K134600 [Paspalum vaginatum]